MEMDKELDCVTSVSSTTNNAQETHSAAAHEANTAAVASECLDTAMEQTPSDDVKRVTPSPSLAAGIVAQRTGWSLSDDDDDERGDCDTDGHVAWHAQKIGATSHLGPVMIDLCNYDSELHISDSEYDLVSGQRKAKDVKQAPKEDKPAPWLKRFDDFSDTGDNEDDTVGGKRKSEEVKKAPWLKKIRSKEPMRPLAKLSAVERKAVLNSIESAADRALMRLLWKIGFRYTLMAHQFEGVRAVAGVPSFFPLAPGIGDESSIASARPEKVLQSFPIVMQTRGLLLADEMGLGKTVQSIGAMILRNKWYEAHMNGTRKTLKRLPTLVVGPNDAVLLQWEETLLKAGVSPSRIHYFRPKRGLRLEGDIFVLLTRYKLQTEVKNLLVKVNMGNNERPISPLFPNAPKSLLHKLKNQYQASNGKTRNHFRNRGESEADCAARVLSQHVNFCEEKAKEQAFRTVVIDEAHFCKNLVAYWGIGSALLGINAERIVPLTGTPYNNGSQDVAALMAYIDASHPAARKAWWDKATSKRTGPAVAEAVRGWRMDYMLLRKKELVLKDTLPHKIIEEIMVSSFPLELFLYDHFEAAFLNVMEKFREILEDGSPEAKRKMKEIHIIMMSCLTVMRKVLIHTMMGSGRELTMAFSPSRRHLLKLQEKPKRCVYCRAFKPMNKDAKKENDGEKATPRARRRVANRDMDMDLDDSDLEDSDYDDDELNDEDEKSTKKKGPIVPLTCDLCDQGPWYDGRDEIEGKVRHFAHEKCIEVLRRDGLRCPYCVEIGSRVHLLQRSVCVDGDEENETEDITVANRTYCKHVSVSPGAIPNGFKASAKIERVIQWYRSVPEDDKMIILSFFKGGLDLLEGILTSDFNVDCARFDGDVNPEIRNNELDRFKTSASCRVLLATVQSGGTGLNIIEANHVCFLDRWFNPTVHAQAQDRCHRIGQEKEVSVAFFDNSMTVDQVMAFLNLKKSANASLILADGSEMGMSATTGLSYQDLSGMIGDMIRAVRSARQLFSKENYNMQLPALEEEVLTEAMEQKGKRVKPVKPERNSSPAVLTASGAEFSETSSKPNLEDFKTIGNQNLFVDLLDSDDDDDDDDSILRDMEPTFTEATEQKGKWPKPVESEPESSPDAMTDTGADLSEVPNGRKIEVYKTIGNQDLYAGLFESDDDDDSLLGDMEPTFKRL